MIKKIKVLSIIPWLLIGSSCVMVAADESEPVATVNEVSNPDKAVPVSEKSFVCLKKMHPIRGFFVDNLLGRLDETIASAESLEGTTYPPGSVVQLIPAEVMIKHHEGWNTKTNDWEFFELDVSEEGSKIKVRGTTQVVNKFGGNCFACHQKAKPQWDFICEDDHGCDSLPIPDFVIHWTQNSDPRCDG